MLKVYFTHDRKVYMRTAKRRDAITTATEHRGEYKHKNRLESLFLRLYRWCLCVGKGDTKLQYRHCDTACVNAKKKK